MTPRFTIKISTVPPPLIVILPPPSTVVLMATVFVLVTVIVTGEGPQLKVTVPPPANAASSAASVQLSGVPVPTTPPAWTSGGEINNSVKDSKPRISNPRFIANSYLD